MLQAGYESATRIAIQLVLQQCCKTSCTLCCPFYRSLKWLRGSHRNGSGIISNISPLLFYHGLFLFYIKSEAFLFFSDNVSRRCDEQGKWQKINITNCHRLKPKEAVDTGKRTQSNITITDKKVKEVFSDFCCMYSITILYVSARCFSQQASSPFWDIVKSRRARDTRAKAGVGGEGRACNDHS